MLFWVLGLHQLQRSPGLDGGNLGGRCLGKAAKKVSPVMAPSVLGLGLLKEAELAGTHQATPCQYL